MIVLRAKADSLSKSPTSTSETSRTGSSKFHHTARSPCCRLDGEPLFESNAIAEYLDEMVAPRLHPEDSIKRARNRAWTDFVPDFSKGLSGIYYTKSREAVDAGLEMAPKRLIRLERAIADERGNDGPYFNGDTLCLVDASLCALLPTLFPSPRRCFKQAFWMNFHWSVRGPVRCSRMTSSRVGGRGFRRSISGQPQAPRILCGDLV